MKKQLNILIAGEGGQGVQKIAEILARAAFSTNLKTTYIPNFTVQQRGGISSAFVRVSQDTIVYPKFEKADWIIILSNRSVARVKKFLINKTNLIYNSTLVKPFNFSSFKYREKIAIPATKIAQEINKQSFNMVMLGVIAREIKIFDITKIKQEAKKIFQHKYKINPELEEQNNKALDAGYN